MRLQAFIPIFIRRQLKVFLRRRYDRRNGLYQRMARSPVADPQALKYKIDTHQEIKKSHLFENKLSNIKLASQRIQRLQILPGEIFSFWETVGPANKKAGYKIGRNLIQGRLKSDYGGGLCQLSGIIYHTALKAGLEIMERHAHSLDIYQEVNRYTPLGADATVAYGYKDLRIVNNFNFAIAFALLLSPNKITCTLLSEQQIMEQEILFNRQKKEDKILVTTTRADGTFIDRSVYQRTIN